MSRRVIAVGIRRGRRWRVRTTLLRYLLSALDVAGGSRFNPRKETPWTL